jgi:hypothetical protein
LLNDFASRDNIFYYIGLSSKAATMAIRLNLAIVAFYLLGVCCAATAEEQGLPSSAISAGRPSSQLDEDMGLLDNIGGGGRFRSVNPTGTVPVIGYSGWWTPQGNPGETHLNLVNASAPVYRSEANLLTVYALASEFHISSPPTLPSGVVAPADLGRVEVGGHFTHKLSDSSATGGGVGFGSASDRPLTSMGVDTYSVDGFYSISTSEQSTWVASLLYSNNNPIDNRLPIPGLMYIYRTPTFVARIGYPFASIYWQPVEPWVILLSMFGPTANGELAYGHRHAVQGFVGFRMMEQSYLRVARADADDRLREQEQRAFAGLRFPILSDLICELQSGYAFDRFLGEGSDGVHFLRFTNIDNSANLGNSWYLASTLRMRF